MGVGVGGRGGGRGVVVHLLCSQSQLWDGSLQIEYPRPGVQSINSRKPTVLCEGHFASCISQAYDAACYAAHSCHALLSVSSVV